MKRLLCMILALALVFSLLTCGSAPVASAATNGHTRADGVAWANAKIGTAIDYDGCYGVQCVDLVNMYYAYLGQRLGSVGYAYNMSASVPAGWQVLGNNCDPMPGDIFVWGANAYGAAWTGHTGIITEVRSSSYVYVDYNGGGQNGGGMAHEKSGVHSFSYLIRPDFVNPSSTFDVNVILDGTAYNSGISGLTFDVTINGSKVANDVQDYCTPYPNGTTYRVDDIRVSGNLIYTGNTSYSGTINNATEVKLPVKTGLTVKSRTTGKFRVTLPPKTDIDLFTAETATKSTYYVPASDAGYTITCTEKLVMSDGSTRYKYPSSSGDRWFVFTSKMTVRDGTVSVLSKTTGTYKITIPANYTLKIFKAVTDAFDSCYYPANSTSYTISCTEKYSMSDGSTRYGYTASSGTKYYFAYDSGMKIDIGCSEGHNYTTDSNKVAKEGTCTSPTLYYKRCNRCGAYSTETFSKGPASGHTFVKSPVEPTCTTDGYTTYRCIDCSYSYTADKRSALGHTDLNRDGKCDRCQTVVSAPTTEPAPSTTVPSTTAPASEDDGTSTATTSPASGSGGAEDTPQDGECNCYCHSTSGLGKIWKVLMAICKVLGLDEFKYCECGSRHW